MSDPLDLAHLVTGAVAAAAPTLPPALGTLARILHAGVSLALTARAAGLDPEQEIARMERALGRFDARADAARAALDAEQDAEIARLSELLDEALKERDAYREISVRLYANQCALAGAFMETKCIDDEAHRLLKEKKGEA